MSTILIVLSAIAAATAPEPDPVVAEAYARASYPLCLSSSDQITRAVAMSDRYASYLVRFEGRDATVIERAFACVQNYYPLPPRCFPDIPGTLSAIEERDAALRDTVGTDALPDLIDDVRLQRLQMSESECTDVLEQLPSGPVLITPPD